MGNPLSSLGGGAYTYNASNQMLSSPGASYGYDNNGNLASKTDGTGTTSYTWDFENRLVSATLPGTGGTMTFKYDPFGRRIYASSPPHQIIYVHDGDNVIEELDQYGITIARYTQGLGIDEPLAMYRGGAGYAYHADGLGSIGALTDSSGNIATTYVYDSFGNQTSSTGSVFTPFRYTARYFDGHAGLYYYRARYYDPAIGRLLSEDPLGFLGKDPNLYRFVRDNPANFVDPLGFLAIVRNFPSDCLPSLQRALDILQRVSNKDARCNSLFTRIGDHRSLKELVEDPRIAVHYDPQEGSGDEKLQKAYTYDGDKQNIYIRPLGCRLGRWTLAAALVHELTHITLTPGAGQEDQARLMEINCGFPLRTMVQTITVRP